MSTYLPPLQVQHGFWKELNRSSVQNTVLTITNFEALALLAFFAGLFSYSQTRLWVAVRHLLLRLLHPNRLDDRENPESLENLSQIDAVRALFRPSTRQADGSMTFIPRWFGILSLTTALLVGVLGATLPYYLTGSGSMSPVKSRHDRSCTGVPAFTEPMVDRFAILGDTFFTQCWLNKSGPQPSCGSDMKIMTARPKLHITRLDSCPFQLGVCLNGTQPIQLEHRGLLPFDLGVNSRSPVVLNHRLSCAPIRTDIFTTVLFEDDLVYGTGCYLWFGGEQTDEAKSRVLGLTLLTRNGPNALSNESSGFNLATTPSIRPPPYAFYIFPMNRSKNFTQTYIDTHQFLRRRDGNVFVALLKAGNSAYYVPINDPFYSAHGFSSDRYFPDHEATALACLEQFQLCLPTGDGHCTEWISGDDTSQWWPFMFYLQKLPDKELADEMFRASRVQIESSIEGSVVAFLNNRRGTEVLLTSSSRLYQEVPQIDPEEQWVLEVQSWFEKAFLRYRFMVLAYIEPKERDPQYGPPGSPLDRAWICDRVLFLNGEFTNIDFVGLITTTAGLLLVCIISFAGKVDMQKCWTSSKNIFQSLLELLFKLRDGILLRLGPIFSFFASIKILIRIGSLFRSISEILQRNGYYRRTWPEAARQRFFSNLARSENELADLRTRLG